jgi:hypothetical protein
LNCPQCNSPSITTVIERNRHAWGTAENPHFFECDEPTRVCALCGFHWLDQEGMDAITLAQFKFEKSMGVQRHRFQNIHEQKLWLES